MLYDDYLEYINYLFMQRFLDHEYLFGNGSSANALLVL